MDKQPSTLPGKLLEWFGNIALAVIATNLTLYWLGWSVLGGFTQELLWFGFFVLYYLVFYAVIRKIRGLPLLPADDDDS